MSGCVQYNDKSVLSVYDIRDLHGKGFGVELPVIRKQRKRFETSADLGAYL